MTFLCELSKLLNPSFNASKQVVEKSFRTKASRDNSPQSTLFNINRLTFPIVLAITPNFLNSILSYPIPKGTTKPPLFNSDPAFISR